MRGTSVEEAHLKAAGPTQAPKRTLCFHRWCWTSNKVAGGPFLLRWRSCPCLDGLSFKVLFGKPPSISTSGDQDQTPRLSVCSYSRNLIPSLGTGGVPMFLEEAHCWLLPNTPQLSRRKCVFVCPGPWRRELCLCRAKRTSWKWSVSWVSHSVTSPAKREGGAFQEEWSAKLVEPKV